MKVLLIKNIKNIGQAGEIKDFSEGYVRNFLLPQKMATLVTADALARHQAHVSKQVRDKQRKDQLHKKLISKINAITLNFSLSANDAGILYGAITPTLIREKLNGEGVVVSDHQILFTTPIKEVGVHHVKIMLDHTHQAVVKVIVTQSRKD